VPEDVAVLSFADFIYPNQVKVGLSAVHHPIAGKGEKAVQILTGLLEGKLDKNKIHQEVLKPKLYVRKTCGAKKQLAASN
jgi:DNA-binding LacI/PurR family transcriptional regulator